MSDGPAGSPAHAGIDLTARPFRAAPYRLPRTRGDRPSTAHTRKDRQRAPPHTRGSTLMHATISRSDNGSPAHAGIDPLRVILFRVDFGLPRTRGDRPDAEAAKSEACSAPPHTRGSTLSCRQTAEPFGGSPAHAGIDPTKWAIAGSRRRLPRTRGDRPPQDHVVRAHSPAPPHTRGSTSMTVTWFASILGSPAHAGIDPLWAVVAYSTERLPRTRGDRPRYRRRVITFATAPPHTRGSTCA